MLLNDGITMSVMYLNCKGINPFVQSSRSSKFKAFVFLTTEILLTLSIGISFFNSSPGSSVMDSVTGLTIATQVICKQSVFLFCRDDFMDVVDYLKKFYPANEFGKEFERQVNAVHDTTSKLLKMYKHIVVIAVFAYLTKPFIDENQMLPVSWFDVCSIRTNKICYIANYVTQCVYVLDLILALVIFDGVFFTLLTYGYCELEQIKNAFSSLKMTEDESQVMLEVVIIIEHHSAVLEYLDKADKLFGMLLLCQFSSSVFGFCMGLLALTFEGLPPKLATAFKNIPYTFGAFCQLLIYCVAGQKISEQSESVADVAYNVKWWVKHQPQLKRALSMVIQRAHKCKQMTAGGVWNLDMITFLAILKGSMSLLAFVQTIYVSE